MDFKTFAIKNTVMPFFVAVTCIGAVMAILGMAYDPDMRFGYQGLLSPLIYGVATALPSLVNYSKRELTVREALVRKLIQVALIETIVLLIVYFAGGLTSVSLTISLVLSVLLVFATTHLVSWINDQKTAREFNNALRKMQESTGV